MDIDSPVSPYREPNLVIARRQNLPISVPDDSYSKCPIIESEENSPRTALAVARINRLSLDDWQGWTEADLNDSIVQASLDGDIDCNMMEVGRDFDQNMLAKRDTGQDQNDQDEDDEDFELGAELDAAEPRKPSVRYHSPPPPPVSDFAKDMSDSSSDEEIDANSSQASQVLNSAQEQEISDKIYPTPRRKTELEKSLISSKRQEQVRAYKARDLKEARAKRYLQRDSLKGISKPESSLSTRSPSKIERNAKQLKVRFLI